jgi:hypothetical protein
MITEDELRDRLKAESVSLMPRGDLLETIATRHAGRHKRARAGLIGGSIAATALVVALLGSLLTTGAPLGIDPASPGDKQIVERAKRATVAARTMIMHFYTDQGTSAGGTTAPTVESWALRSEKLGRIRSEGRGDKIVRPPNFSEDVDYIDRTVTTQDKVAVDDVVPHVAGSGITDPDSWFDGDLEVRGEGGDIRMAGQRMGLKFEFWVDAKTYMLKRAVFGSYKMTIDWLPATAENRELLEHTVPADFKRQTYEEMIKNKTSGIPTK